MSNYNTRGLSGTARLSKKNKEKENQMRIKWESSRKYQTLEGPGLLQQCLDRKQNQMLWTWTSQSINTISRTLFCGEQGMTQCGWERSPPLQCGLGSIPGSGVICGRVCCWFSSLLREVLLRVLRFSPLLKNHNFKFQVDLDYCQALYYEPLANVIVLALPVFDI